MALTTEETRIRQATNAAVKAVGGAQDTGKPAVVLTNMNSAQRAAFNPGSAIVANPTAPAAAPAAATPAAAPVSPKAAMSQPPVGNFVMSGAGVNTQNPSGPTPAVEQGVGSGFRPDKVLSKEEAVLGGNVAINAVRGIKPANVGVPGAAVTPGAAQVIQNLEPRVVTGTSTPIAARAAIGAPAGQVLIPEVVGKGAPLANAPAVIPPGGAPAVRSAAGPLTNIVKGATGKLVRGAGRLSTPAAVAVEGYDVATDMAHLSDSDKLARVAEGTSKVAGSIAGGIGGVTLGAATGPLAPIASPILGLAGGVAGYMAPDLAVEYGTKLSNWMTGNDVQGTADTRADMNRRAMGAGAGEYYEGGFDYGPHTQEQFAPAPAGAPVAAPTQVEAAAPVANPEPPMPEGDGKGQGRKRMPTGTNWGGVMYGRAVEGAAERGRRWEETNAISARKAFADEDSARATAAKAAKELRGDDDKFSLVTLDPAGMNPAAPFKLTIGKDDFNLTKEQAGALESRQQVIYATALEEGATQAQAKALSKSMSENDVRRGLYGVPLPAAKKGK